MNAWFSPQNCSQRTSKLPSLSGVVWIVVYTPGVGIDLDAEIGDPEAVGDVMRGDAELHFAIFG